jgi:hypothetical protein
VVLPVDWFDKGLWYWLPDSTTRRKDAPAGQQTFSDISALILAIVAKRATVKRSRCIDQARQSHTPPLSG